MNVVSAQSGALDYDPCHYGTSRLLFRGPERDLDGDYIAFLGSTETFGRFIPAPFPALVERATGRACVNLGCRDGGVDAFLSSPALIDIASRASVSVVQVMGAVNMSNRFYTVDPRRNQRFIRASKRLKEIYPEVDFREFEHTADLLTGLARVCPERLQIVRREVQAAWVARMRTLIRQIDGPVVLLWLSDHAPYSKAAGGTICRDPLFIDRPMLSAVCGTGAVLVEVVVSHDEIEAGVADMVFSPAESAAAREMLGPIAHLRAGEALETALRDIP